MASGLFAADTATKATSKSMKILKVAIASTGIGLLVVALGSLVAFFTKTQRGANIVSKAMAGIGATIDVLIDRLSSFGEGLFKIFSGDFSDGIDILKNSFVGLGAEIAKESVAAVDLSERYEALRVAQAGLTIETRKRRAEIKALNKDAEDTTLSEQERFAAIDKAIKTENELQGKRVALAKERLAILKEQNALSEGTTEDLEAEAEAEGALFAILEESDEMLTTLNNKRNILSNTIKAQTAATIALTEAEQKADMEAFSAKLDAQNKARDDNFKKDLDANIKLRLFRKEQDALNEEDNELRLEKLIEFEEAKFNAIINTQQLTDDELILLEEQKQAAINGIREQSAQEQMIRDEAVAAHKIAVGQRLLGQLIQLAGKESSIGKALALFQIGTNTAVGVSAATKVGAASGPFPANLAAIAAGVSAVLGGALQARQVLGTTPLPKFEKGGRIGGKRHSNGGTIIEAELGEHVMNRKATNMYGHGLFDKINNLEIDPNIINGKSGGSNVVVIDNSDLAKEFRNRPNHSLIIDSSGFTSHIQAQNATTIKKVSRYSV
jgi:hypothetical protein